MRSISKAEYREYYMDNTDSVSDEMILTESEETDFTLPERKAVSHKYNYGRALIIGGAVGYSGAPVLAANACERGGAGVTQLMVPDSVYSIAASRCDGTVVTPLPSTKKGRISSDALPEILSVMKKADACALGPGLGIGDDSEELVRQILAWTSCPLVLDADGLTVCARDPGILSSCQAPLILTPHEEEFRRIGGNLTGGRLAGALQFTAQHPNVILILKGHGTLVCRNGDVCVNPTGCPAMAKGGSGDVLAGLLCALLAQGFDPWFSARCAVYLHGLSGNLVAEEMGEYSLAPSDLIHMLPRAFQQL